MEPVKEEPSVREILWRQYSLQIELYKYYLDLVLKANVFFYLVTGTILSFYFANFSDPIVRYSLILPIVMSLGLAFVFFYGAKLMRFVREDIFQLRDQLGLSTAPDVEILTLSLRVYSLIFVLVAIALALLVLLR